MAPRSGAVHHAMIQLLLKNTLPAMQKSCLTTPKRVCSQWIAAARAENATVLHHSARNVPAAE
eukprot:1749071-Pleurochrysis_carterae.AAC.1